MRSEHRRLSSLGKQLSFEGKREPGPRKRRELLVMQAGEETNVMRYLPIYSRWFG